MGKHPGGILGDVKTPDKPPHVPNGIVEKVIKSLSGELEAGRSRSHPKGTGHHRTPPSTS